MNESTQMELKLKLSSLTDLWKNFCEMHTTLYEFTCDEYMHLLASEIEKLNEVVQEKLVLLEEINKCDLARKALTDEITALLGADENLKLKSLLAHIRNAGEEETAKHVEKLNLVLLDIIEKIQDQNKKNQVFLNKAIHSLQELREGFVGKANYKTYSATGTTRSNNTY